MTNHCKLACKQCTLPGDEPPETASDDTHPASPSSLTSEAADTAQKGAAVASEAAGKVLDTGKEAVTTLVTNATGLVKNLTSGMTAATTELTCLSPCLAVYLSTVVCIILRCWRSWCVVSISMCVSLDAVFKHGAKVLCMKYLQKLLLRKSCHHGITLHMGADTASVTVTSTILVYRVVVCHTLLLRRIRFVTMY